MIATGINCGIGWSLLLRICAVNRYFLLKKEYLFAANIFTRSKEQHV